MPVGRSQRRAGIASFEKRDLRLVKKELPEWNASEPVMGPVRWYPVEVHS